MTTTRIARPAADAIGGMLWFVETPAKQLNAFTWKEAITLAAEFYYDKYKRFPTVIRMNPADFTSAGFAKLANMKIVSDKNMIARHVLVSEEGKSNDRT